MDLGRMMATQKEYIHGGTPQADMARLGLKNRKVLDFSVNLNPLGPPDIIRKNWVEIFETIENYPSVKGDGVSTFYQERFGLSPGNVLPGNGSTELIYLVARVFRFKRVAVLTPSFHDYERASLLAGAQVIKYALSPENDFSLSSMDGLIDVIRHAEAVWLGRPNNPSGTILSKDCIIDLAGRFPDKLFILDEAFIQFLDEWEDEGFLSEKPGANIIVIHSLTKFYAIAGLRLGGMVGSEGIISRLREKKEPWSVNGMAERIAQLLMDCGDYEERSRAFVRDERRRIVPALRAIPGIHPFSSTADFILCQWDKTENLDDLIGYLLSNGVYVRDCRNFEGLEHGYFRIGLKQPRCNDTLISLLASFPDDIHG